MVSTDLSNMMMEELNQSDDDDNNNNNNNNDNNNQKMVMKIIFMIEKLYLNHFDSEIKNKILLLLLFYIFGILNIFIIMIEYSMPIYMRRGERDIRDPFQKLLIIYFSLIIGV